MLDRGKVLINSGSSALAWPSCTEFTRLILAGVYSHGAAFRRGLLIKAMDPVHAPPLEIGFDPRPAIHLAWKVERESLGYRAVCALILLAYIVVLSFRLALGSNGDDPDGLTLVMIGVFAGGAFWTMTHSARQRSSLERFTRENFNLEMAASLLEAPHDRRLEAGIGGRQQRVLVYRDFEPFKCAGAAIGRWSFTVDVEKPAHTASGKSDLVPISLAEIDDLIAQQLPQSGFGDLITQRIVALRGTDAWTLPLVSRNDWAKQPTVALNEMALSDIVAMHPDFVREYLLFHDVRWDGELILTHAVKTTHKGRIFYIEASRFLLTPPFKEFRTVDTTNFHDHRLKTRISHFVGEVIASPFVVLGEVYNLIALFAAIGHSGRSLKREYRDSVEANPRYDYGATESTRREVMDEKFEHYFQKTDLDFAIKAFDQCIVELVCGYMETHGVDVSDLRKKVMAIYNSGILVQGGDVTAQAMAVGQGANATSSHNAQQTVLAS
ncbi:hypothetical protein [Bradyrhizobium diversitatis]|uniref:Uncharacterized protein n=1 Tax=Bradyrhizobium diversitatis TaxID=2755406 RepID=A0ABS0PDR0_9BRAD|nr:hypothetical protein [Bradyrhizobium diversitatis]MBH5391453.1 hypothetical protein [Bradyrhizobium diversitatis]